MFVKGKVVQPLTGVLRAVGSAVQRAEDPDVFKTLLGFLVVESVAWVVLGIVVFTVRIGYDTKVNNQIGDVHPTLNFSKPTVDWSATSGGNVHQCFAHGACPSQVTAYEYVGMDVSAALICAVFLQMMVPALRLFGMLTQQWSVSAEVLGFTLRGRVALLGLNGFPEVIFQSVGETLVLTILAHMVGLRQVQYPIMLACLVLSRRGANEAIATMVSVVLKMLTPKPKTDQQLPQSIMDLLNEMFGTSKSGEVFSGLWALVWLSTVLGAVGLPLIALWTSLLLAWRSHDQFHPYAVTVSLWMWFAYHMVEVGDALSRPSAIRAVFSEDVASTMSWAVQVVRRFAFMATMLVSVIELRDALWTAPYMVEATTMIA